MQATSFLRWFPAATLLVLAMWLQPLVPAAQALEMPDRKELIARLRAQDFAALETRLGAVQAEFEAGRVNDNLVFYAFEAFANSDDALDAPLANWVERMPKSGTARLARGLYLEHRGWLSRGDRVVAGTPDARFARMIDYFRLAGAEFDRALALQPRLTPTISGLMRIAMTGGRHRTVKSYFDAGIASVPQSHLLHVSYMYALRPEWGGSVEAVKAHVAHLAATRPERTARYMQGYYEHMLGDQAHRSGNLKRALEHYDRALTFGSTAQFHYDRAKVRFQLDMRDAALEDMRRAMAIAPNAPRYLAGLADIEMFSNRPKEAITVLTLAIAGDVLNPAYLKDRAWLYLTTGRRAEAETDIEAAMTFGDLDPSILRVRSRILIELDKSSRAVESAKRALALAPNDSRSHYEYAQALYFNQDCKAHEAYAEFRRLCPLDNHCDAEKGMAMPGVLPYFRCEQLPRK